MIYFFQEKNPVKMNSGELRVDVPLACGESDCEDGSGNSLVNTPSKNADNKLKTNGNGSKKPPLSTSPRPNYEGGGSDSLTGSLEDLVSSFDEKLTMCFQDYQEQVDKIAPVQVRIQARDPTRDGWIKEFIKRK